MEEQKQEQAQGQCLWDRYPMGHTEIKSIIRENINAVCRNYIAIGYYLKQVQGRKLYLEDGYQSLGEYAQAEYGIEKTAASRLIQVVGRFCVEGNTPVLLPEYREFSVSKLKEMLYLTEEQMGQVTADTTVKGIRELRREEPEKVEEREGLTETAPEEFELTFEPEQEEDALIRMELLMEGPETGEEEDLNEPPELVEGEYREVEKEEPEEGSAGYNRQVKRLYTKRDVEQEICKCEHNFNLMEEKDINSGYRYVTNEFMKYDAYCLLLKALEAEEEEKEDDDME